MRLLQRANSRKQKIRGIIKPKFWGRDMSFEGRINTTFGTYQADLFESGLVAQIGANAFVVWAAIKAHSDFKTGVAWPSIRRLMQLTGLANATVQKCLDTLEDSHLLRSEVRGRKRYYIPRERLDVSIGTRVLCTIVIDYVPATMRDTLNQVKDALAAGKDSEAFAQVDIIPGAGFDWDPDKKLLRASIRAAEVPSSQPGQPPENSLAALGERLERQARLLKN